MSVLLILCDLAECLALKVQCVMSLVAPLLDLGIVLLQYGWTMSTVLEQRMPLTCVILRAGEDTTVGTMKTLV